MDAFVWLANPDTGAVWQCPAGAAEVWQARGWLPCAAPVDVDLATVEQVSDVPAVPAATAKTSSKSPKE